MTLTPWLSRSLALLLTATVAAMAFLLVVLPLIDAYRTNDAAISDARDLIARYERIAQGRPALEKELVALDRQPVDDVDYLEGGNESLSAASLQGNVSSLIGSRGARLGSIQTLPGQDEKGLRRVAIRVQMSATNETALHILYDLEAGKPLLFVDNLTINRAGSGADNAAEEQLTVAFDLYGFLRSPGAQAGSP